MKTKPAATLDADAVAEIDREITATYASLVASAKADVGAGDRAKELVHEASIAVREGRRVWDRARTPSFTAFMLGVVKSLRSNELTSSRRRFEARHEAYDEASDAFSSHGADPESVSIAREEDDGFVELVRRVHHALPNGSLRQRVLALGVEEGITDIELQAELLDTTYEKVSRARAWFMRRAELVRAVEVGGSGAPPPPSTACDRDPYNDEDAPPTPRLPRRRPG